VAQAHGGENNASEFTTTEQLALQGLVGGISTELRGGKFQDGFVSAIISTKLTIPLDSRHQTPNKGNETILTLFSPSTDQNKYVQCM
jgi:hypothetical protein